MPGKIRRLREAKCQACKGLGKMPGTDMKCGFCDGKGYHKKGEG